MSSSRISNNARDGLAGRWARTSPRARALTFAIVVVVGALAAVALALRSAKPNNEGRVAATRPAGMAGMAGPASMTGMHGMDMSAGGAVALTADQIRQFGVTFDTAALRTLTPVARATGVVVVNETELAQVTPRFAGFVERLYVSATGQAVRRGQPLMDIYSPELVAAQQELLIASRLSGSGVAGGSTDLAAAARQRLRFLEISDAQINEVLRTGRPRRTLTLYAPAGGVVLEKNVVQGQAVQPGQMLYTIADLSDVWVDVQVREADAESVRPGTGADIDLAGLPGPPLKGRVAYVYPTLDSASRAIRARVVVSNDAGRLKPGMYATVRLRTPTRSALTVPSSAVLRTGERDVVFTRMTNGQLMPVEVRSGRTAGDLTEILGGLAPGQVVVTSAQFLLDSESNLGEVMKAMISQMAPTGR